MVSNLGCHLPLLLSLFSPLPILFPLLPRFRLLLVSFTLFSVYCRSLHVFRKRNANQTKPNSSDFVWPLGALTDGELLASEKLLVNLASFPTGFPAAYGRGGYPGYPGFGYPFAGTSVNQLQGVCIPVEHNSLYNSVRAALQPWWWSAKAAVAAK